jgi:hypothetical protein
MITGVMGSLQALTVEDVDEAASGISPSPLLPSSAGSANVSVDMWNNGSDDMPTDSDSDNLTSP